MRRRIGLLLIFIFLMAPLLAEAQPAGKIPRVGVLVLGSPDSGLDPFRQGLQDLGYVEGQNITIAYRFAAGTDERLPELAAKLVGLKVDIIVAYAFLAARAAKQATQTIPIVMVDIGRDPVAAGLVESLAHPGGNVTGLTDIGVQLHGKRLELLKEVVPLAAHVAVLVDGATLGQRLLHMQEAEPAARALGLTVQAWEVQGTDDFERVFAAMTAARPDAVYVAGGPLMIANRQRIADFAIQRRLPSVYELRAAVETGGLMSYGPSRADLSRRAAAYVDKILKVATPADLPVERPMTFELVINLKTAQALGLTIPPALLFQADEVIR